MITSNFLDELDARIDADAKKILRFSDKELAAMSFEDANAVIAHFSGQVLMQLPQQEIQFFKWVKTNDPEVWQEMWGDGAPYAVSIAFLQSFVGDAYGFPISDLDGEKNYYFHKGFIVDVEKERLINDLLKKTRDGEPLSMDNIFLLDIWLHPTDIWRFAYKYGYELDEVRTMIHRLVEQGFIIHPKKREEIADFIEW